MFSPVIKVSSFYLTYKNFKVFEKLPFEKKPFFSILWITKDKIGSSTSSRFRYLTKFPAFKEKVQSQKSLSLSKVEILTVFYYI